MAHGVERGLKQAGDWAGRGDGGVRLRGNGGGLRGAEQGRRCEGRGKKKGDEQGLRVSAGFMSIHGSLFSGWIRSWENGWVNGFRDRATGLGRTPHAHGEMRISSIFTVEQSKAENSQEFQGNEPAPVDPDEGVSEQRADWFLRARSYAG